MSVAGSDYDRLKRYNPAEIYNPTPKPVQKDAPLKEDKEDAPAKETKEDAPAPATKDDKEDAPSKE